MSSRLEILVLALGVVALGASASLALPALLALRRRPRRFCPGLRPRGVLRRAVGLLLIRSGCGYDLSHGADRDGGITCPECGADGLSRRSLRRHDRRIRLLPASGLCLVAGAAGVAIGAGALSRTTLLHSLPTSWLIEVDARLGDANPGALHVELRRRFDEGTLTPEEWRSVIPRLVQDLGLDERPGNATRAMERLSAAGPWAWEDLQHALTGEDPQRRGLAARRLMLDGAPVTGALLDALCERLVRVRELDGWGRRPRHDAAFLGEHAERCVPALERALKHEDDLVRFGAALAASGAPHLFDARLAVPVLVDHLADNELEGDGTDAADALLRFGPAAQPFLEDAIASIDEQQAVWATALLLRQRPQPSPTVARVLMDRLVAPDLAARSARLDRRTRALARRSERAAVAWLLTHARALEPCLREAARSADPRLACLATAILRHERRDVGVVASALAAWRRSAAEPDQPHVASAAPE